MKEGSRLRDAFKIAAAALYAGVGYNPQEGLSAAEFFLLKSDLKSAGQVARKPGQP